MSGIQAAEGWVLWGFQLSIEGEGDEACAPEDYVELGHIIIGYRSKVQRGILNLKAAHHMAVHRSRQNAAACECQNRS